MADIPFKGGLNIAIKIPKSKYEETVGFYRDILKLEVEERPIENPTVSRTHRVKFGMNTVWLDCVDNYTHAETWLELRTPDVERRRSTFGPRELKPVMSWKSFPMAITGSPILRAPSYLSERMRRIAL